MSFLIGYSIWSDQPYWYIYVYILNTHTYMYKEKETINMRGNKGEIGVVGGRKKKKTESDKIIFWLKLNFL